MSATTGNLSTRPSAGLSHCQYVHVSELRNVYDEAVATSSPALYGQDSGAFDIPFDDFISEFSPATLSDIVEDGADIEHSQVENGEWYDLSRIESDFEDVFEKFRDTYDYVDYPTYNADIERIYRENEDEVEEAHAELIACDIVQGSIFDMISRAVNYAVEIAYHSDIWELSKNFASELGNVDTVDGTAEY